MTKILGFTDSTTQCDCCGKSGLKGTYAVELDGTTLYYGSVCVKRNLGLAKDSDVKNMINSNMQEIKSQAIAYFKEIGGNDIFAKMTLIDAFTPEWEKLDSSYEALKLHTKNKFNISF